MGEFCNQYGYEKLNPPSRQKHRRNKSHKYFSKRKHYHKEKQFNKKEQYY